MSWANFNAGRRCKKCHDTTRKLNINDIKD